LNSKRQILLGDFGSLLVGQTISEFGNSLFAISFTWLIWTRTHSTIQIGMLGFLEDVPQLILGLWIGIIIAKYDKRIILLISDIVRGLAILGFVIASSILSSSIAPFYFVAVIEGVMLTIFRPARMSIVPELVGNDDLEKANAISITLTKVMNSAGYALSGLIISIIGVAESMIVNSLSFFISSVFMYSIKRRVLDDNTDKSVERGFLTKLKIGMIYMFKDKRLLVVFLIGMLMNAGGSPILTLVPALVGKILKSNTVGYGLVFALWFLGMTVGGYIASKWKMGKPKFQSIIGFSMQGIAQLVIGLSHEIYLSLLMFFLHGMFISIANVPFSAFIQRYVRTEHRDNFYSVFSTLTMSITPLSMAGSGILAAYIGISLTFISISMLQISAGLLGFFLNFDMI